MGRRDRRAVARPRPRAPRLDGARREAAAAAARAIADLGADARVRAELAARFVAEAERRFGNLVSPPPQRAPREPWRDR